MGNAANHPHAGVSAKNKNSRNITIYKPPRLNRDNNRNFVYNTDALLRHKTDEIEIYESLRIIMQYAWPNICIYINMIPPDSPGVAARQSGRKRPPAYEHIRALQRYYIKYGDAMTPHTAQAHQKIMAVICKLLLPLDLPRQQTPEAHSGKSAAILPHNNSDTIYAKALKKSIVRSWSAPDVYLKFLADNYARDAVKYIRRAPIAIFTIFYSNMIRAFGHKPGDKLTNRTGLLRRLQRTYTPDYATMNRLSNRVVAENTQSLKTSSIISTIANVIIAAAVLAMVIAIIILVLSLVTNLLATLASINTLATNTSGLLSATTANINTLSAATISGN